MQLVFFISLILLALFLVLKYREVHHQSMVLTRLRSVSEAQAAVLWQTVARLVRRIQTERIVGVITAWYSDIGRSFTIRMRRPARAFAVIRSHTPRNVSPFLARISDYKRINHSRISEQGDISETPRV